MPHDGGIPFLREVVIFLAIAAILVPLFQRVRISPVLGFLVAGVIVGPNGLGAFAAQVPWIGYITFTDVDSIAVLAEFGIVFLLFLIGSFKLVLLTKSSVLAWSSRSATTQVTTFRPQTSITK